MPRGFEEVGQAWPRPSLACLVLALEQGLWALGRTIPSQQDKASFSQLQSPDFSKKLLEALESGNSSDSSTKTSNN